MPQTRVVKLNDLEYAILSIKEDDGDALDAALKTISGGEFHEEGHGLIEDLVRPVLYSGLKEHDLTMTELKIVKLGVLGA